MNWHARYKAMKKAMGWTNKDVAEITGNTHASVRAVTKPSSDIPRWLKLAIVVFESK